MIQILLWELSGPINLPQFSIEWIFIHVKLSLAERAWKIGAQNGRFQNVKTYRKWAHVIFFDIWAQVFTIIQGGSKKFPPNLVVKNSKCVKIEKLTKHWTVQFFPT